jgi:hypothetical protein
MDRSAARICDGQNPVLFSISTWRGSLWIFATTTLPSQRAAFADVVRMIAPANAPPWLPARLESWAQGLRHDQRFDGPTKADTRWNKALWENVLRLRLVSGRARLQRSQAVEPFCCTSTQTGRQYDDDEARPHVSCIAEACNGSSDREFRLHFAAKPGFLKTRRAGSNRRKAWLSDFQSNRSHRDDAQQG